MNDIHSNKTTTNNQSYIGVEQERLKEQPEGPFYRATKSTGRQQTKNLIITACYTQVVNLWNTLSPQFGKEGQKMFWQRSEVDIETKAAVASSFTSESPCQVCKLGHIGPSLCVCRRGVWNVCSHLVQAALIEPSHPRNPTRTPATTQHEKT